MSRDITPYTAFLVLLAAVAGIATVVGFGGLFVVLTGGTTDEPNGAAILGESDCETLDGGPDVLHEAGYEIERTLRGGTEIDSLEVTSTAAGISIDLRMRGELLDASAGRPNGTAIPVAQDHDNATVVIERADANRLRVWIDTVSQEATVTRTILDICPTAPTAGASGLPSSVPRPRPAAPGGE